MAKKKIAPKVLLGAEEFAGPDAERDAIEKIANAKAAAAKEAEADSKNGDNGGPIMDEDAWRRAANEAVSEDIEIGRLMEQVAEARGRLSSIRKVAKSCGVDWDVVKDYVKLQKRIRNGEMGSIVTEHRRMGDLMKIMDCPLYTQFSLFATAAEEAAAPKDEKTIEAEATLAGEHAGLNGEPIDNCPYTPGTSQAFGWRNGWQVGADKLTDSFKTGIIPAGADASAH